jgi:hypothetical protein
VVRTTWRRAGWQNSRNANEAIQHGPNRGLGIVDRIISRSTTLSVLSAAAAAAATTDTRRTTAQLRLDLHSTLCCWSESRAGAILSFAPTLTMIQYSQYFELRNPESCCDEIFVFALAAQRLPASSLRRRSHGSGHAMTVAMNPPGDLRGELVAAFWRVLVEYYLRGWVTAAIWVGFNIERLSRLQRVGAPLRHPTCVPRMWIAYCRMLTKLGEDPPHATFVTLLSCEPREIDTSAALGSYFGRCRHGDPLLTGASGHPGDTVDHDSEQPGLRGAPADSCHLSAPARSEATSDAGGQPLQRGVPRRPGPTRGAVRPPRSRRPREPASGAPPIAPGSLPARSPAAATPTRPCCSCGAWRRCSGRARRRADLGAASSPRSSGRSAL